MMLFLSVLKDIFWSNQFAPADGQRLDRDRYLLGFTALYALANALNVGARLLYPDSADFLYDGETPAVRLMWLFYSVNIMVDPLTIVAHVLLARRLTGPWLMVPVGLINYAFISLAVYGPAQVVDDLQSILVGYVAWTVAGILLLWLLVMLYALLLRPSLSSLQPQHPLLRMNPALPADQQLNTIQLMWRGILLGVVVAVLMVGGFFAFYDIYSHSSQERLLRWSALVGLGTVVVAIWMLVQRARNMGWSPWRVVLLGAVTPALLMGLMLFMYTQDYFNNLLIFMPFFLMLPWFRMALAGFQLIVLLQPAPLQAVSATAAEEQDGESAV